MGENLRFFSDKMMRQALEIVKKYLPNGRIRELS